MSKNEKFVEEGLTYDDVLLIPAYSDIIPRDATSAIFEPFLR